MRFCLSKYVKKAVLFVALQPIFIANAASDCIPSFINKTDEFSFPPYGSGKVIDVIDKCWLVVSLREIKSGFRNTKEYKTTLYLDTRNIVAIKKIKEVEKN